MKRKWKRWALCAAIALGSAVAARSLGKISPFQQLHLNASDFHFLLRGKQPTANIMLVVADQKALNTFPEFQVFWHPYFAKAIQAAGEAGARVIGLDIAYGVPVENGLPADRSGKKPDLDNDRVLAEAVYNSPVPVVCGFIPDLNGKQNEWPVPINQLAATQGLAAFANLTDDPADGFYRRQELIEAPSSNPAVPQHRGMAMLLAEKYTGMAAQFQDGRLSLQGRPIPIDRDRTIVINYAGGPDTFFRVSLADFVKAADDGDKRQLRDWVAGKAVLIGPDNSLEDRYSTPFYTGHGSLKWTTAGVEIHANTLRTLLDGRYLLPVNEWQRWLALLLVTALTAGIVTTRASGPAIGWLALLWGGILVGTHLLFRTGSMLSTSELVLASVICLIASIVYRFATAQQRGDLFRKALGLFVGSQFAASLDNTQVIALSGKRLDVTILFTDIRSFTAFSERVCDEQGPEKVVQLLNHYMGQMVAIIVRYHGNVNKFIGDGILAIFSDDDEGAVPGDHAVRAVKCAAEVVAAPSEFSTGAGLHTGPVVVGNVGSADKMEFTVLGDTVNLASRLESLNKEHHTKLLMSEATQALLGDSVKTIHLASVPVRGKAALIDLFTVASLVPSPDVALIQPLTAADPPPAESRRD
jgi:adenylate cyclase